MKRQRFKLFEYEHDADLCARGCGRGCSRNTYERGFADAMVYAGMLEDKRLKREQGRNYVAHRALHDILKSEATYDGVHGERGLVPLRKALRQVLRVLEGRD